MHLETTEKVDVPWMTMEKKDSSEFMVAGMKLKRRWIMRTTVEHAKATDPTRLPALLNSCLKTASGINMDALVHDVKEV